MIYATVPLHGIFLLPFNESSTLMTGVSSAISSTAISSRRSLETANAQRANSARPRHVRCSTSHSQPNIKHRAAPHCCIIAAVRRRRNTEMSLRRHRRMSVSASDLCFQELRIFAPGMGHVCHPCYECPNRQHPLCRTPKQTLVTPSVMEGIHTKRSSSPSVVAHFSSGRALCRFPAAASSRIRL